MSPKNKNRNLLVRLFGAGVVLHHGDTLMFDCWCWLKRRLPPLVNPLLSRETGYPGYSLCLEAYKPRFASFTGPDAVSST